MLQMRPSCEHCNQPLPGSSPEAMICSFECTFCRNCVEQHFADVCPNCGGNLTQLPIRPAKNRRNGNFLGNSPASEDVVHRPKDLEEHRTFRGDIERINPTER
jgi:hypothetical protein